MEPGWSATGCASPEGKMPERGPGIESTSFRCGCSAPRGSRLYRASCHNPDEMSPIGGIRMDVAVHLALRDGDAVECFRSEVPAQGLFHLRHPEHAVRAGPRHGDARAVRMLGHEHADE